MPANDKTMAVVGEWIAKAENNDVVANCDLKQEARRQVRQSYRFEYAVPRKPAGIVSPDTVGPSISVTSIRT